MKVKKNYKLYLLLLVVIFTHQLFLINSKNQHGCGADLPLNFLVKAESYQNNFSGFKDSNYYGSFLKIDCDVVDVVTPTGDPNRYLLLENSNTIERPLHSITAIPFRYLSTFILKLFSVDIIPSEYYNYSADGSYSIRSFYLSWYYAHLFQNLLLIFVAYYLFSKLFNLNYISTVVFYSVLYLPNIGKDILSPDMNMWIPISLLLNLYLLKVVNNSDLRRRVLLFTSFTILIYPIFIINYLFYSLIVFKQFLLKKLSFKDLILEGLFLIAPYFFYRLFLLQRDLNFSPISWQCLDESSATDYCYGLWLFVKVTSISDITNYLSEEFTNAISRGEFVNFVLISIFVCILFLYKILKGNLVFNFDYFYLFFCVLIVLLLIGVFNERYINYLPTTILFYLMRNKENQYY